MKQKPRHDQRTIGYATDAGDAVFGLVIWLYEKTKKNLIKLSQSLTDSTIYFALHHLSLRLCVCACVCSELFFLCDRVLFPPF